MEVSEENVEKPSEKVIELREKLRNELQNHRVLLRTSAFDKNRFLESEILNEKDIIGLTSRIKRRKRVEEDELIKLGNSFFQNEENISTFIKITGGINVIVKEFIGHQRQLLAAQCIYNLSLGNEVCCSKIAVFCGAYLMIYFRSIINISLNKVCIWIAQNVCTSSQKGLDILMSQELLKNTLYIFANSPDTDNKSEALQLLDIIIDKKWNQLDIDEKEDLIKIILNYIYKHSDDYLALQCLHRTQSDVCTLNNDDSKKLTERLCENVMNLSSDSSEETIYFSINILTLLFKSNEQFLIEFLEVLVHNGKKLSSIINECTKIPKLYHSLKDLMSFAASIFQYEHSAVKNYISYDDLPLNLQIPKVFEF